MNTGQTVFAQLMEFLPLDQFHTCVQRYGGDHRVHRFSCYDQFLCMAFAQLTYRESLRDIETCLRAMRSRLYHMGIHGTIARSTLADANESRDWRIYADFAQVLIHIARKLYAHDTFGVDLENTVYALDSTTIDLCLSLFPWARFRKTKGAIKLHALLDLRGPIPSFIRITDGKVHDVNIMDDIIPEADAFYIMDRAYLDFGRFHTLDLSGAFFVTRAKHVFDFRRRYSRPVDKATGLRCDQTIVLTNYYPAKYYPGTLRRIGYFDVETKIHYVFLTNNFPLPALTITKLYKCRWGIEIFFKWIKQNLRIKSFYGTSLNAVKTQIWVAISVYVLVAIIKKRLNIDIELYTILQILSVTIFDKVPLLQLIAETDQNTTSIENDNQLLLFEL
jgi:hypothetical protein